MPQKRVGKLSSRTRNRGTVVILEGKDHIKVLKLKAAMFGIMTFKKMFPTAQVVHLRIDNIVALSYLKKIGDSQQDSFQFNQRNMGLSLAKWDRDYCRIPAWSPQPRNRCLITLGIRLEQVNIRSRIFLMDLQSYLDCRYQLIWFKGVSSGRSIYTMA